MWKIKVLIQFVLAHLPFGEQINHWLQLLNAGDGGKLQVRIDAIGAGLRRLIEVRPIEGAVIVEVGTGWDALPTIMLYAAGAMRIHTYDHVRHLRADMVMAAIRKLLTDPDLLSQYLACPASLITERLGRALAACETGLSSFFAATGIVYNAPADALNTGLPDRSVDIYYSYTVLEHVPEFVAQGISREARRLVKQDGVYYAAIWLHDQYSGFDKRINAVNFLRYPEWLWALMVKNKISYMNRLRERDFLDMLEKQDAEILKVTSILNPENVQHVKSMKIDKRFANYSPEELAVTFTEIIAQWPDRSRLHSAAE